MSLINDLKFDLRYYVSAKWPNKQIDSLMRFPYFFSAFTKRGFYVLMFHRFRTWVDRRYCEKKTILAYWFKLLSLISCYLMAVIAKTEMLLNIAISPGIYLSNKGNIIIGAKEIGAGCVIQKKVTIGANNTTADKGAPSIGDNVWVGADSIILGEIHIGNGTTLLEGTVLSKSVPPNCVIKGNPARIVKRDFNNAKLLAHPEASSDLFIES